MSMRVLASMAILGSVALAGIQGELLNSNHPWFVLDDANSIYLCEWSGNGEPAEFYRGDTVDLSTCDGEGVMSSATGEDGPQAAVRITTLNYTGGIILNDESPWLVGNDAVTYRAEFLAGQPDDFHRDDSVILSQSSGTGYMLRVNGDFKVARVSIETTE
ncbi:MAG TPA: hypothetical protein VMH22_12365 [bacterium]|nr:hypothetical protein [bacterium]